MGQFAGYVRPSAVSVSRINPLKVLIVVNSDSTLSQQVADYYETQRGLKRHRVNISLGTNPSVINAANRYQDIILPIANYCELNGIECVLSSAHIWPLFQMQDGTLISTDSAFGSAKWMKQQGGIALPVNIFQSASERMGTPIMVRSNFNNQIQRNGIPASGSSPVAPDGFSYPLAKTVTWRLREKPLWLPFGRIGNPKWTSASATETLTETQRMITDALWAEQQRTQKTFCVGLGGPVSHIKQQMQWMIHEMAKEAGHVSKILLSSYGATDQSWFGQAPEWTQTDALAGVANIAAHAYIGAGIGNPTDTVSALNNSLFPLRGAWGYESWSFGYRVGAALIMKGACAAIGSVSEPLVGGIPDTPSVATLALRGWSLAEIVWLLAPMPWMVTAFGDPLYRPFPTIETTAGTANTVSRATAQRSATTATPITKITQ